MKKKCIKKNGKCAVSSKPYKDVKEYILNQLKDKSRGLVELQLLVNELGEKEVIERYASDQYKKTYYGLVQNVNKLTVNTSSVEAGAFVDYVQKVIPVFQKEEERFGKLADKFESLKDKSKYYEVTELSVNLFDFRVYIQGVLGTFKLFFMEDFQSEVVYRFDMYLTSTWITVDMKKFEDAMYDIEKQGEYFAQLVLYDNLRKYFE